MSRAGRSSLVRLRGRLRGFLDLPTKITQLLLDFDHFLVEAVQALRDLVNAFSQPEGSGQSRLSQEFGTLDCAIGGFVLDPGPINEGIDLVFGTHGGQSVDNSSPLGPENLEQADLDRSSRVHLTRSGVLANGMTLHREWFAESVERSRRPLASARAEVDVSC